MVPLRYLTMKDVRKALGGRSRSAIYNDLDAGRLPQPLRLGGRLLWRSDELESHLARLADDQRDHGSRNGHVHE